MSLAYPVPSDDRRRPPISPGLRRALVFAWLGPVFGLLATLSMKAVADGGYPADVGIGIVIVFFFSLIVFPIAGIVDGVLAYVVPVFPRVILTTLIGAMVAVGLSVSLGFVLGCNDAPSLLLLMPVAAIGALSTGVCSLFSQS